MSYNKVNKYIAAVVLYCLFLTPQLSAKVGDVYKAEFRLWNRVRYWFEIISQERKECKIIEPIYPTEMPPTVYFFDFDFLTDHIYTVTEIESNMMSDPDQLFPVSFFYLMRTRKIGDYAFYSANLKHDYGDTGGAYMILERIKSIGQYAFYNTDITEATIYYYKKLPDVYENSFSDWTYENCDLTLYYTEEDDYRMHPVWSKFKKVKSEYWSKVEDIEQEPDADIEIIGNMIHIDGIRSGSRVELYDLSGRCIKSCPNCSERELNIQMDSPGVYICKVNNEIKKVMIH